MSCVNEVNQVFGDLELPEELLHLASTAVQQRLDQMRARHVLAYEGRDVGFMECKLLLCTGSEPKCSGFAEL